VERKKGKIKEKSEGIMDIVSFNYQVKLFCQMVHKNCFSSPERICSTGETTTEAISAGVAKLYQVGPMYYFC
jgi:hypothetical protein